MIDLYNSNITKILPESLAGEASVQALGYAINKAMKRLIDHCQYIGVYAAIDTAPEKILDMLALDLNTQYYDDSLNIEVKRALIKNTLVWYMGTGTPAAVVEMVEAVFGNGEIQEWFEYGGEPYHFKINTSNINSTDEMIRQIEALIGSIQNVRSYLEEVSVEVMQQLHLFHGCTIESTSDSTTIGINMNI